MDFISLGFTDKGLYHWLVSIEINQPYLKSSQIILLPQFHQAKIATISEVKKLANNLGPHVTIPATEFIPKSITSIYEQCEPPSVLDQVLIARFIKF